MKAVIFDHYISTEADFDDRRWEYRPHRRCYVPVPLNFNFPKGGNGNELGEFISSFVNENDVCANMQIYTGPIPSGFVVLD